MRALKAAVLIAALLIPVAGEAMDGKAWLKLYNSADSHVRTSSVLYVLGVMEGLSVSIAFVAGERPSCNVSANTVASMVSDLFYSNVKSSETQMDLLVMHMLDRACPGSMNPLVKKTQT